MKKTLTFLMLGLAIMGIACNIQFYSSVSDGIGSFFYGSIGFLFDVSKLTLVVLMVFFYYRNETNHALASFAGWLVLSVLSLVAAYGFFGVLNQQYEQKQLAQSNIYAINQQNVETANTKVDALSQFANPDVVRDSQNEKAKLTSQRSEILSDPVKNSHGTGVGSLDGMTGGCTQNNWYSRKYCGKLSGIDNRINELDAKINGFDLYVSAVEHRDNAMLQLSGLSPQSIETSHHPVFLNLATVFDTTAPNVKSWFLLITAFVLEALASLLFYLRASLSQNNDVQSVNFGTQSAVKEPLSRVSIDGVQNTANENNGVQNTVFEKVKSDLLNGVLNNPSFKSLRKYGLKDGQINEVREMLIKKKVCIKTDNGKLATVR